MLCDVQVPPNHLLSASVMSAPAALAMSKLFYPETEKVKHTKDDVYNMKKGSVLTLYCSYTIPVTSSPYTVPVTSFRPPLVLMTS